MNSTIRSTSGTIQYKTLVDNTKIQFPRLTAYNDVTIMNRVNDQIDELTKNFQERCGGPPVAVYDRFVEVTSQVEYAAKQIFSIYAELSTNCGAHPVGQNVSVTFDLRTGKKVQFAELFKSYEVNKDQILKIIFAKQIAKSGRLTAAGKSDDNPNCDEDPGLFSLETLKNIEYVYNFSNAGLAVEPEFVGPSWVCGERVTVPYQQLKV